MQSLRRDSQRILRFCFVSAISTKRLPLILSFDLTIWSWIQESWATNLPSSTFSLASRFGAMSLVSKAFALRTLPVVSRVCGRVISIVETVLLGGGGGAGGLGIGTGLGLGRNPLTVPIMFWSSLIKTLDSGRFGSMSTNSLVLRESEAEITDGDVEAVDELLVAPIPQQHDRRRFSTMISWLKWYTTILIRSWTLDPE